MAVRFVGLLRERVDEHGELVHDTLDAQFLVEGLVAAVPA